MTIVVQTKTTCECCGTETIRNGAEGGCAPVGWFHAELTQRHEGRGWSKCSRVEAVLCPACAFKIADTLRRVGMFHWVCTPSVTEGERLGSTEGGL